MSEKQLKAKTRAWRILRLRGMWRTAETLMDDKTDIATVHAAVDRQLKKLGAVPEGGEIVKSETGGRNNDQAKPDKRKPGHTIPVDHDSEV